MERAEYNRHSRARVAETAKNASRHATPDAPERIDRRRRCTRHGSSDVLPRIAQERVPTASLRLRHLPPATFALRIREMQDIVKLLFL